LQPKVVHITDNLADLSTLLRRLIGAGIELKMIHGRDLWTVKVDVSQLEQVIINLVVNARDAITSGGTLTICTSNFQCLKQQRMGHDLVAKGEYVMIEVIDTGHGISPEHLEHIFEPFFSTKEVGEGTGLGLSTVYGIVKQTGGFVLVDSMPNEGTTFKILLPRFDGEEEAHIPHVETPSGDLTGGGTILLVEDEDAVRMFSARALREKGYRVIEADSGESALDILSNGERFDLLVTDVVMPKMDGPTLSKKIRDLYPDTKTIFISGYTEDTFRKNLDHNAKIHFLPKPFTLKDLALKVKEVLTVSQEM
jgi:two-component system cell cycle sensor histidine kinase/response regulator CckA